MKNETLYFVTTLILVLWLLILSIFVGISRNYPTKYDIESVERDIRLIDSISTIIK
jgi:hypothetical protein